MKHRIHQYTGGTTTLSETPLATGRHVLGAELHPNRSTAAVTTDTDKRITLRPNPRAADFGGAVNRYANPN